MRPRRPSTTALLVWVVLAVGVALVARVLAGSTLDEWRVTYAFPSATVALAAAVSAVVLLDAHPGHALGRAMAVTSVSFTVGVLSTSWLALQGTLGFVPPSDPSTVDVLATAAAASAWVPGAFTPVLFLPLLLPDGRLPSRAWRWHQVASAMWIVASMAVYARLPFRADATPDGFRSAAWDAVAYPLAAVLLVVGVVGLLQRFRGADPDARHQLRRLGIGIGVLLVAGLLASTGITPVLGLLAGLPYAGVLVLVTVAADRHGWLDLDHVVSRAVTAGLLALFVALVYVVVVVGLGQLAGSERGVLSLVATAVVAVAFHPIRTRLDVMARRLVYGSRATPYEVLAGWVQDDETEDVLLRAARLVAAGTGAERATIWRDAEPAATWPPLAEPSPQDGDPRRLVVDVTDRRQVLGAVSVTKPRTEPVADGDRRLVSDLARGLGVVLANDRLTAELRRRVTELERSRQRLVGADDDARRTIGRALERGARDRLREVRGHLLDLEDRAATDDERITRLLGQLADDAARADAAVDEFARGVFPTVLEHADLGAALRDRAARSTLAVLVTGEPGRLPRPVEAAVWFVCSEALQNVAKYADASAVVVRLERAGETLRFEVADDGRGFDIATAARGAGVANMHDRIDALGGTLDVISRPGAGTRVVGSVPVASRVPA